MQRKILRAQRLGGGTWYYRGFYFSNRHLRSLGKPLPDSWAVIQNYKIIISAPYKKDLMKKIDEYVKSSIRNYLKENEVKNENK